MIPAHEAAITSVAFSPDGKFLASYSCDENRLSFWQVSYLNFLPFLFLLGVFYKRNFFIFRRRRECSGWVRRKRNAPNPTAHHRYQIRLV